MGWFCGLGLPHFCPFVLKTWLEGRRRILANLALITTSVERSLPVSDPNQGEGSKTAKPSARSRSAGFIEPLHRCCRQAPHGPLFVTADRVWETTESMASCRFGREVIA